MGSKILKADIYFRSKLHRAIKVTKDCSHLMKIHTV
jgi:hypothetical protein